MENYTSHIKVASKEFKKITNPHLKAHNKVITQHIEGGNKEEISNKTEKEKEKVNFKYNI
jgi:hypothetical protein